MDQVWIRYVNNRSTKYDGKDYLESIKKNRRKEGATGKLQPGELVLVKTKSRVWNAIVISNVRVDPEQPS